MARTSLGSDDGTAYELIVGDNSDIACTCMGGVNGRVCKHMGAVALRLEVDALSQR